MQAGAPCPGLSQILVREAAELREEKCLNAARATQRRANGFQSHERLRETADIGARAAPFNGF